MVWAGINFQARTELIFIVQGCVGGVFNRQHRSVVVIASFVGWGRIVVNL